MSEYYISPNTASTGHAMCGLAMCGIYGIYNNVPDDVDPGDADFPEEYLPLLLELNGEYVYPLKGTLTWNESLGSGESTCSCSYIASPANRPSSFMRIRIGIGTMSQLLWAGYILSFTEEKAGGQDSESNIELKYTIKAVNFSHYFVRRIVLHTDVGVYSRDILKYLINTYMGYRHPETYIWIPQLKLGQIDLGTYYDIFEKTHENISSIVQQLAQEGDLCITISPDGYVSARAIGTYHTPFDLIHSEKNFCYVQISENAGQTVTRLLLETTEYKYHLTTACNSITGSVYDEALFDYPSSAAQRQANYCFSSTQSTFYVDYPIGYIYKIIATFIVHDSETETHTFNKTWLDPIAGSIRNGIRVSVGGAQCSFGEQFSRIANEGIANNYESHTSPYRPHSSSLLSWELREHESGKNVYLLENDLDEIDETLFPFDWTVSYNSNTINFNSRDAEMGTASGQFEFKDIAIYYYEAKTVTKTYNNTTQQAYLHTFDTAEDGIIEQRLSYPELTLKKQHDQLAEAFFRLRGEPQIECSYTTYLEGIDILRNPLRPGMQQALQLYDRDDNLIINDITYTVRQGVTPEFEADVTLTTQQRDLSNLITRMIRGK